MDDTKLSRREEAYLDALIEGLENLVSKLSTTELSYSCNDLIAYNTALNSLTADGFYGIDGKTHYYCHNHDVATGVYECPYADVIDNTICCTTVCVYNKHPDFKKNEVVNNFNENTVPF